MHELLTKNVKYELSNNFNTAIVDGSFPASGSFYDVAEYDEMYWLIRAGTLDSALTCQVQQAATISGALTNITGAVSIVAADDDNELKVIRVQTRLLTQRFVTLTISGAAGGNDYLDVIWVGVPRHMPVTQNATVTEVVVAG
jgi:hypothetical protein